VIILVALCGNGFLTYQNDKKVKQEKAELNQKIDNLSLENYKSQKAIENLLNANDDLQARVKDQSFKIDELNQQIVQLIKLLEKDSIADLEKTNSHDMAKQKYESAISLMSQGNQKEAAQKLLEFREIAVKEGAYEAAALSSLIASHRFQNMGEEEKAAQLQSEAGDFFIKLDRLGEAKVWKNNAREIYERQDLSNEMMELDQETKILELRLNK
jgi:hypothetical protein